MVSLLNTFAWCIAFVLATVPMMIDFDYSIFSIIIFFGTKWILFPRKKILQAVDEWSHQEKTAGARVEYFSSTSIPTNEPIIGEKSSEKEQPVSVTATTSDAIVSNIPEEHIEARKEPSRLRLWIGNFFSERPLAKVGGILLFLGALFFLYLIFDLVGPVGKICIGLLFGFFLIGTGLYLDKKEIIIESRVLFGIGIAVNFLTILSGRHLLSTTLGSGIPLFSDTLTTVCILMNTALAVVLSLVYRSRVLLGFAFIFAYLTPFLIGSDSSSAILLTIYTTILTVAIALINTFYAKQSTTENISYLQ